MQLFGMSLGSLGIALPSSGTLTVDNGQVHLALSAQPGGPFSFITAVELVVTLGIEIQMVRVSIAMSLGQLLNQIFSGHKTGPLWESVNGVLVPLADLFASPTVILATADGQDGDYEVKKGVNFYQTINLCQVPPLSILRTQAPDAFSKLVTNPDQQQLLVRISASPPAGFEVAANLLLNQSLCRSVTLNSIGISAASEDATNNSIDADIAFTVNASGTQLALTGGVGVETSADGATVHGYGRLAADQPWVDPLGAKGITISGLAVDLGVTSTFPYFTLGCDGTASIGRDLIGGTAALYLNPSDPAHTVFQLTSKSGISLPKLLHGLVSRSLADFPLFDISLTDLDLYFSPSGGTIAGKQYDSGFRVNGALDLWGWNASVHGVFDYTKGGYLDCTLDVLQVVAEGVQVLKISSGSGDGKPVLKVHFDQAARYARMSGLVSLFNGAFSQSIDANVDSSGFAFTFGEGAYGLYRGATMKFNHGLFSTTLQGSFQASYGSLQVAVTGRLLVEASSSSFAQTLTFSYDAVGQTHTVGPLSISLPLGTVTDMFAQFILLGTSSFLSTIVGLLATGTAEVFAWAKAQLSLTISESSLLADAAVTTFLHARCPIEAIAKQMVAVFSVPSGIVLERLRRFGGVSAQTAARIAKEIYGATATQSAQLLKVAGYADTETAQALKAVGYVDSEIKSAMKTVWNWADSAWKILTGWI